jgi:hypothetical protein
MPHGFSTLLSVLLLASLLLAVQTQWGRFPISVLTINNNLQQMLAMLQKLFIQLDLTMTAQRLVIFCIG